MIQGRRPPPPLRSKTMNIIRKALIDRMINLYNPDSVLVAQFINLCKRMPDNPENDKTLITLVESHEEYPQ